MGIRFSFPKFLLIVVSSPGISACAKKDWIGSQQGNYVYTRKVHS